MLACRPLLPSGLERQLGFWSNLGNAVVSAASRVGNAVQTAVDAAVSTTKDAFDTAKSGVGTGEEWLCSTPASFAARQTSACVLVWGGFAVL
jgi:hypothetical protein